MLFAKPLLQAALVVSTTTATNLYVASSDGIVTTLALSGSGNSSSLAITSTSDECSVNPAALNLDHDNRILYCLDRGENKDINGSMNTFSVDADGKLSTRLSRLTVPASGVWAEFVENPAGVRGIATAHFNKSAATIIGISADGGLLGPLQTWFPTVEAPGPFLDRQDRSFLHQVIVDPTGKFVLMLDLGGDRIRVYALNEQTLTPVAELPSLATEPGVGPRHGVFWQCGATGKQYIIFNGELDQKVHSYEVTYTDAGLTWVKVFDIPALGVDGEVPAMTAPTSECALTPDNRFIIISNRDVSFKGSTVVNKGPSDTLSTFSINDDGTLTLVQLAPSGGWSPRQFALNQDGSMLAVGHQNNDSVVLWQRDLASGLIVGRPVTVNISGSAVATIWDE